MPARIPPLMTPDCADRPNARNGSQLAPLVAFGAVAATLLVLIALGHDGRRVAQLMALAVPVLAWLVWPVRSPLAHRIRTSLVWLWAMGFAFDGMTRAYLLDAYQASPNSSLVQTAAANTNDREAVEFLSMYWRSGLVWCSTLLLAALIIGRYARDGARHGGSLPRWAVAVMCVLLVTSSIGYLSKPWRRLHPVMYWTDWSRSVLALRAGWANQQDERTLVTARAEAALPSIAQDGPATVVLVITDSINRDNMALYGYGHPTTPRLQAHKAQLDDQLLVLRNAWSVDASTIPALRNMFNFGLPQDQNPQHVMALARAASYKVWWMSNHDDVAIEQQHARLADVVEIVNRTPGRASVSLDGELLDCVQEALEDPAERKLIVVHLMGAHPHYRLRFPAGGNPFDERVDDVEDALERNGRSLWVRKFRQEYDAALLYHDFVVSQTLQLTREVGRTEAYRAWMSLSDHGQEVGHEGNHVGHSPTTASGYKIPTLIWRSDATKPLPPDISARPFRADWAAWTIADLLNIRWQGDATDHNVLADGYQWRAPVLPVKIMSFED